MSSISYRSYYRQNYGKTEIEVVYTSGRPILVMELYWMQDGKQPMTPELLCSIAATRLRQNVAPEAFLPDEWKCVSGRLKSSNGVILFSTMGDKTKENSLVTPLAGPKNGMAFRMELFADQSATKVIDTQCIHPMVGMNLDWIGSVMKAISNGYTKSLDDILVGICLDYGPVHKDQKEARAIVTNNLLLLHQSEFIHEATCPVRIIESRWPSPEKLLVKKSVS